MTGSIGGMNDRVTRVLLEHDPVFADMVSKMMPASSDVSAKRGRLVRRRTVGKAWKPSLTKLRYRWGPRSKKPTGGSPAAVKPPEVKEPGVWSRVGRSRAAKTGVVAVGAVGGYEGIKAAKRAQRRQGLGAPQPQSWEYGKSADGVDAEVEFSKVQTDKRQVFGWASITHRNGEPVIDRQGDYIDLDEVEKSAYNYVVGSRVGGRQHRRSEDGAPFHAADMIESLVVTPDKREALGIADGAPQGWWVGFKVNDDDTWDAVKRGEVTGFSIHGRGKRADFEGFIHPEGISNVPG